MEQRPACWPGRAVATPYRFRAFRRPDLHLAARWLDTAEVRRWWGDPAEQLALLAGDLHQPRMRQWIVAHEGRDFAYAQAYQAHAWPQHHLEALPAGAEVIDSFIGEPSMIGQGHGSAYLRMLAHRLLAEGAPVVAIDPDFTNVRARRAYARAGFTEHRVVETDAGRVVVMLLGLEPALPLMATD